MVAMKQLLWMLASMLLFIGCDADIFGTKKLDALKEQNEALRRQLAVQKKQADLELQKQKLQSDTAYRQAQLQKETELEKMRLSTKHQRELEALRQKRLLEEQRSRNELYKYAMALAALVLIIVAFFLYLYLKRKREDKLMAYNDNLKKYLLYKEHKMKMEVATKILDAAASQSLSPQDRKRLVAILSNEVTREGDEVDVELLDSKQKE